MEETKVKSLSKALKVLECFNAQCQELGVTQISNMLNLNKSNVHNIVSTFEHDGYLEQNPATGRYRLGIKLLEFSYIINEKLGYQRMFHDIMQELSKRLSSICYFAIYQQQQVFYLCNSYPPDNAYNYPFRSIIGERAPLYCTSLGKSMLAYLPPEELEKCLQLERVRYTDNTLVDEDALREEIRLTRQRGYGLDNEEHEYGTKCVSVPVFQLDGTLLGALSVSSPILELDKMADYANELKAAARVMRERL